MIIKTKRKALIYLLNSKVIKSWGTDSRNKKFYVPPGAIYPTPKHELSITADGRQQYLLNII